MIDKSMSIGEVLSLERGTARIMMEFGLGCLGCPHAMMESLEMGCAGHGVNADELVDRLNAYFAEKNAK